MNKKQISLLILTLFLSAYLINAGYMARATQEKLGPAADLKTYTYGWRGDGYGVVER